MISIIDRVSEIQHQEANEMQISLNSLKKQNPQRIKEERNVRGQVKP